MTASGHKSVEDYLNTFSLVALTIVSNESLHIH